MLNVPAHALIVSAQSARSVRLAQRFNGQASTYDHECRELNWGERPEFSRAILKELEARPRPDLILDVACGTGLASKAFEKCARTVIGLDISERMLEVAAEKNAHFSELKVFDLDSPLEWVGIELESVDVLICSGALHYALNWKKTLKNFARALSPTGLICLTFLVPQDLTFSDDVTTINPLKVQLELKRLGIKSFSSWSFVGYFQNRDSNSPVLFQALIAGRLI